MICFEDFLREAGRLYSTTMGNGAAVLRTRRVGFHADKATFWTGATVSAAA